MRQNAALPSVILHVLKILSKSSDYRPADVNEKDMDIVNKWDIDLACWHVEFYPITCLLLGHHFICYNIILNYM